MNYIYPSQVGITLFPSGVWSFSFYGKVDNNSGNTQLGITYFARHTDNTETDLFTVWSNEINNTTDQWFKFEITNPNFTLVETDRMGARVKIRTTHNNTVTVTYAVGDGYGAYLNNPNKIRHNQLRALNEDLTAQHFDSTTNKVTPVDADKIGLWDSITNKLVGVTWANIKATLKSYFDTLYATVASIIPLNTLTAIAKQLTGFDDPAAVVVTHNVDNTITLSGTITGRWRGLSVTALESATWTSTAHGTTTTNSYYLYYNGTSFVWTTTPWDFTQLMIAYIFWNGFNWIALREPHGLMDRYVHEIDHFNVGTTMRSGGDLGALVLNSTTVANRRPTIAQTVIVDEDNPTTNAALAAGEYTHLKLTGAAVASLVTGNADIIPLLGNNPYYNSFNTPNWGQTLFANNAYGKIFVLSIPTAQGTEDQKCRFVFVQPQTTSGTLSTIKAVTTASLNLGQFASILNEVIAIDEIIVRFTATNWVIISYNKLTGSKLTQFAVQGNLTVSAANVTEANFGNVQTFADNAGAYIESPNTGTGAISAVLLPNRPQNIKNQLTGTLTMSIDATNRSTVATNEYICEFSYPTVQTVNYPSVILRWAGGILPALTAGYAYIVSFWERLITTTNLFVSSGAAISGIIAQKYTLSFTPSGASVLNALQAIPTATLSMSGYTVTAVGATPFTAAMIGLHLYIGSTYAGIITAWTSTTVVTVSNAGTIASAAGSIGTYLSGSAATRIESTFTPPYTTSMTVTLVSGASSNIQFEAREFASTYISGNTPTETTMYMGKIQQI